MKTIALSLLLLGCAASAPALDKAQLDHRIRVLTEKFEALQAKPDRRIPPDLLRQAQGVVLLNRTKAGFIFAYQGGGGVALVKDPQTGAWSPAAFVKANEASLGVQIGGEQSFRVILLLTTNATRLISESKIEFAGEARGTAGEASAGEEGKISASEHSVLVYADRKGLFGGAAIRGGSLSPDDEANRIYYDQYLTLRAILFDRQAKPTEAALDLAKKLSQHAQDAHR